MKNLLWIVIALLGAFALAVIALTHGEHVNALWLMTAAACTYLVALRFYSRFIALKVLGIDATRRTPAHVREDGLDYVPTHPGVLFGHHFAAIAGAGPLIGPVLATQMGYAPGALWIVVGAVLAGCVQDMVTLFLSTRRGGASLGSMIVREMGAGVGTIAQIGILLIMIILLAVLALVVVKALAQSPWGTFTVAMTIPIALFMGAYLRWLRPGKIGEMSVIGVVALIGAVVGGAYVAADPTWAKAFTLDGTQLAIALMAYGFLASVLPVWLLLAPRDYLSTFLKIGTILLLALGIVIVRPELKMPAFTPFIDGTGPIFAGKLFPFLFITIACGAVSGFHALIASGTTPKMIDSERHIAPIGYGAMLCESFVAIMALIAASTLEPGVYFAVNAPAALIGTTVDSAAIKVTEWGFGVTPDMLAQAARDAGETSVLSRVGGAPTLALAMAQILAAFLGGPGMTAFWYHFAILFEALFILTTLDAGTRVGRFLIQDFLGRAVPAWGGTRAWVSNLIATTLCVGAWGWFLYQGVIDPLGGINSLWPLFGISNQMLAGIALALATVVLLKMKRGAYALVTGVPLAWLMVCTLLAGWQKLFHDDAKIGFLAHLSTFQAAFARGEVLAPAKSAAQMQQVIANDIVDASLCAALIAVVVAVAVAAVRAMLAARRSTIVTALEEPA